MPAKTCTYHCSACGRHFHSLDAFDMHRAFSDPEDEDWARRVCLDPERDVDRLTRRDGQPRLIAYTRSGECRISQGADRPVLGVVVWQVHDSRHDRLVALRARAVAT